jgi:transketolase
MGKGVSFIEDKYQWHGIPPNEDEMMNALTELENNILN